MDRFPVSSSWGRCLTFLVLSALLLSTAGLSGCSYGKDEPGLFGRSPEPTTAAPSELSGTLAPRTPAPTNPSVDENVPVVGEAVWTSGDGRDIQLRYAVHAVRRIPGATVLDWSITPLSAPGLGPGDAVPRSLELGLGSDAELGVFLVDDFGGSVYRPLAEASSRSRPRCLCTPLHRVQEQLRIGQTRLLQIAYPTLPDDLATVDVDIQTVPMMFHVPVTGLGQVPLLTNPVSLADPAEAIRVGTSTPVFSYGTDHQRLLISVDAVLASSSFTSVEWTIQSVTGGTGVASDAGLPIAESPTARRSVNRVAASGLRVRPVGGALERPRLMTVAAAGRDAVQCLCTDLRRWTTSLQRATQQISVVTDFPALPIGTEQVDVVLPGLDRLRLDVTAASDGSILSAGPVPAQLATWPTLGHSWPTGWSTDEWPTPLPVPSEVRHYFATTERLLG